MYDDDDANYDEGGKNDAHYDDDGDVNYDDDDDVAHCCTIFLCHLDLEIYDRHRHPNLNIREIIWLGD